MKELTKEWIKKADNDLIICERESLSTPPVYDAICFHAEQAVEKYLKAILQEKEKAIPKTHDLEKIVDLCKEWLPHLEDFVKDMIWLTSFAVEIRYPGIEAQKEEAFKAFEIAKQVEKVVKEFFKNV